VEDRARQTKPRLLDEFRTAVRVKHYSYRTEQAYVYWARRYIFFHNKRHPNTMGSDEVRAFCSHLAESERVSASTQNQAFNALVFLYKHVIKQELGAIDSVRARRPRRIPVVLTRTEVERVLSFLTGTQAIMATLLYGSGLRLMECHRLRVKDIDIEQRQIIVRDGKGFKDRITVLPEAVIPDLQKHLKRTKALHEVFTERGFGEVELPYALERKYPNAKYEWGWQYVFPANGDALLLLGCELVPNP
jgi:integron integrase